MKGQKSQMVTAVIGCGHWGQHLIRNFSNLGGLACISDTNRESAKHFSDLYDVQALSFEEILADDDIPAVAIATPAVTHFKLAKAALQAGKHVFVEKPLALVTQDAEELCRLAAQENLTLMVGHLLQYHPAFLKLKEIVHNGNLGGLQYLYSNRLSLGKIRREENILWSFAPHDISMILSLVDEDPAEIKAVGGTYLNHRIADVTTTHLSFSCGVNAHVFVSWLHPFKEQKLVVVGTKGMAVFNDGEPWERKVLLYPHEIDWHNGLPVPTKADALEIKVTQDEPLKLECTHFLECAALGTTPRTDGIEGLRVLKILQASQDSLNEEGGG